VVRDDDERASRRGRWPFAPERRAEVESFIDFMLKRAGSASPGAWDGETEDP